MSGSPLQVVPRQVVPRQVVPWQVVPWQVAPGRLTPGRLTPAGGSFFSPASRGWSPCGSPLRSPRGLLVAPAELLAASGWHALAACSINSNNNQRVPAGGSEELRRGDEEPARRAQRAPAGRPTPRNGPQKKSPRQGPTGFYCIPRSWSRVLFPKRRVPTSGWMNLGVDDLSVPLGTTPWTTW